MPYTSQNNYYVTELGVKFYRKPHIESSRANNKTVRFGHKAMIGIEHSAGNVRRLSPADQLGLTM